MIYYVYTGCPSDYDPNNNDFDFIVRVDTDIIERFYGEHLERHQTSQIKIEHVPDDSKIYVILEDNVEFHTGHSLVSIESLEHAEVYTKEQFLDAVYPLDVKEPAVE